MVGPSDELHPLRELDRRHVADDLAHLERSHSVFSHGVQSMLAFTLLFNKTCATRAQVAAVKYSP